MKRTEDEMDRSPIIVNFFDIVFQGECYET